jgi:hypothetical protein
MNTVCCPTRKAFLLYVDLDPTPGTFHTPGSAYVHVQGILENHIKHYKPVAVFSHTTEHEGRMRACFAVFVNLDPVPGVFHTQESAQNVIRGLFTGRIAHYNPMVSLGPASIQFDNILEGIAV